MSYQEQVASSGKVRLVTTKRETSAVWVPDRYEYNAKGRLPWLQRLLFGLLRKLKADSFDMAVTYSTIDIDTNKIIEALMRNQRDVRILYDKRARYVVMGPQAFAEFHNAPEARDFLRFSFNAAVGMNRNVVMTGLECVVVPWIEGFFVLPDLNETR